jgi:glutamyl-Q tRNA(Asp) synthetase
MTPQAATRGQEPFSKPSSGADVVTRFAPSPTGRLHLGHAYSALLAHDFARARGGRFLLRIEDIDAGRSRPEHVTGILEDLAWLGLSWDGEVTFQSQRLVRYAEALERLKAAKLLYPCFCTRKDIAASASAPHSPAGVVYPGTCRRLAEGERLRRLVQEPYAWRLDMAAALARLVSPPRFRGGAGGGTGSRYQGKKDHPQPLQPMLEGSLFWRDHERPIPADLAPFGDVVLARKDAPVSYHLAVTVDDAVQGVSDVVRGADLFAATHVHRLLQALLDLPTPHYHHHPLILGPDGERLAKRHGARSLAELRERGADPREIVAAFREGRLPAGYSPASA